MTYTNNLIALKSKPLFLHASILDEAHSYLHYKMSGLLKFTGDLTYTNNLANYFWVVSNQFLLDGYEIFMATTKIAHCIIVDRVGLFHLIFGQEKSKLDWSLYDTESKGKNYVAEAICGIIARLLLFIGTPKYYFEYCTNASVAVAKGLSATFDPENTQITNASDEKIAGKDVFFNFWRHHKGTLT
jgi:hypothetical protein